MNIKISTRFALTLIVLLAVAFGLIFWMVGKINIKEPGKPIIINNKKTETKTTKDDSCIPKAYQGEVSIKVWLTESNENIQEKLVSVAKDDIEKLPNFLNSAAISSSPIARNLSSNVSISLITLSMLI